MKDTDIQWCDGTVNPIMGCEGCPLFTSANSIRKDIIQTLVNLGVSRGEAKSTLNQETAGWNTSDLSQGRSILAEKLGNTFELNAKGKKLVEEAIWQNIRCYASILHLNRGENPFKPERKTNKGYAPRFEEVKLYPGRAAAAAGWSDLTGTVRAEKPWLNGLPRLIFVSDMGDALSSSVPFDYLRQEIVDVTASPNGQRHLWLWLTKRPGRMAQFGQWLTNQGIAWPDNLVAMTSVLDRKMAKTAVDQLRKVPARIRGLSVEPLWEGVELDLSGIDWVIVGGESGSHPKPFELNWARSLREQCQAQGVAFFVKQLGKNPTDNGIPLKLSDKHGGEWDEWPGDLRIREMPEAFRRYGR